jgi:eukaryotic-like serine/threonine-protein kinase
MPARVAPDRTASSSDPALERGPDGRSHLQSRLALYSLFTLVFSVAYVGGFLALWSQAPPATFEAATRYMLSPTTSIFGVVSVAVWLLLRSRPRSPTTLRAADVVLQVAVGFALASSLPHAASIAAAPRVAVFDILLGMLMVLTLRALIVPSSWRRTAAIGAITGALLLPSVVIWGDDVAMPGVTHQILVGIFVNWIVLSVAVSSVASGILYGLRREVRDARSLGQYTLLEPIGEGGMGVVYRARHAMLRRPTAVKLITATGNALHLDRFEQEVQHMASLAHPNIVTVYDYGRTQDGTLYYAMELLDGADLERIVEAGGPLPPARVIHLLIQACRALAGAHAAGLVHRDIKPGNLFVCREWGSADALKVLDFGLVKDLSGSASAALTHQGAIMGTPLYMAPETWMHPESVDARSDLYSLGAVAYFLLTGRMVFSGSNPFEVMVHHTQTPPERPSQRGFSVPGDLEDIVMRCLAKDPAERHAGAEVLRAHLEDCELAGAWRSSDARDWWVAHPRVVKAAAAEPVAAPRQTMCIMARRRRGESVDEAAAGTADTAVRSF